LRDEGRLFATGSGRLVLRTFFRGAACVAARRTVRFFFFAFFLRCITES